MPATNHTGELRLKSRDYDPLKAPPTAAPFSRMAQLALRETVDVGVELDMVIEAAPKIDVAPSGSIHPMGHSLIDFGLASLLGID